MCDQSTLSATSTRRARKSYTCCECAGAIAPGTQYEHARTLYDGHWSTHRTCSWCCAARARLLKQYPYECYCHGDLLVALDANRGASAPRFVEVDYRAALARGAQTWPRHVEHY